MEVLGVATGTRGGVTGGIESGVEDIILRGVKRQSQRAPVGNVKRLSAAPASLAMNQTPSSPAQQAGSAKLLGTVYDASKARVPERDHSHLQQRK